MTHPPEAVDALARALFMRVNLPEPETGFLPFDVQATALLDRLAPLLVAAEREECAKVAEDRSAAYEQHIPKMTEILGRENVAVRMMHACAEDSLTLAAAIRERGTK
jgi:hypothetical protein